jgi:hypothetical protein
VIATIPLSGKRRRTGRYLLALVLALGNSSGCGAGASRSKEPVGASSRRVWWSSALELSSLVDLPRQIARPFPDPFPVARAAPGAKTEQDTVSSCASYFAKSVQGFHAVSDQDFALLQAAGARCHALRLLADGGFRVAMLAPPVDLRRLGLDALPAVLGPQVSPADRDARDVATRKGLSWRAFEPAARFEAGAADRARVSGADWSVVLELWATGDFEGRGTDQLLVFTQASGTEGSWQESKLRILGRSSPVSPFRVIRELKL